MMQRLFLLLVMLSLSAPAVAGEKLDVNSLLKEPGVRMVVVEFWADYCEPCKRAIPQWRKLHEKYRARGLRLVVVAVQSEGGCSYPGWKPDMVVCDEEGNLAEHWGVASLPQAFVWTWQGRLLVEQGHVGEAASAIDRYFEELPRIAVEEPTDPAEASVAGLVRSELRRVGKLDVVATEAEREMIAQYRKGTGAGSFDESTRCELGKEVSPNSVLRIGKEAGKRVTLQLFSLETACMMAQGRGRLSGTGTEAEEKAVVEAVAQLVRALGKFQEPQLDKAQGDVAPTKAPVLEVKGKPRGALVQVAGPDGFKAEKGLPARFDNLAPGGYNVRVTMAGYQTVERGVQLKTGRLERVNVQLLRRGAVKEHILTMRTEPVGAVVSVDGNPPKKAAPKASFVLSAGKHTVTVMAENHLNWSKEIDLDKNSVVTATLVSNLGALEIRSEPDGATIFINGEKKGKTPATFRGLEAGTYAIKLQRKRHRDVVLEAIAVDRGKTAIVDEVLPAVMGIVKFSAVDAKGEPLPAEIFVDGKRLGEAPLEHSFMVGTYEAVIRSGHAKWSGQLIVKENKPLEISQVLAPREVLYRLTLATGSGVLLWEEGMDRTHVPVELGVGVEWKKFVFELAGKMFLEGAKDVYALPGVLYFPRPFFYVRGAVPVRVVGGFDYGLTIGSGLRLGWTSFAFFGEVDATVLSGSGLSATALEGKVGVELLF